MTDTRHVSVFAEGHDDEVVGATCDECRSLLSARRAAAVSPAYGGALFGIVPGGARDTVAYYRDFVQGMDEYSSARKAGLRPLSTNKGGVERTERLMESQAKALRKLDGETDVSKLKTHPGVQ